MPRLNVNLNDETADALRTLSERRDTTMTETVRRAVALAKWVDDQAAAGHRIYSAGDGGEYELVLL